METIKGRLGLGVAIWLQVKICMCGLGLWRRLNAGPVCGAYICWGGIFT